MEPSSIGPNMFGERIDELFRSILATTAGKTDHDTEENFIVGCYILASIRAALQGRKVYPIDAEFVFSLWCRWPLKPDVDPDFHHAVRGLREFVFSSLDSNRIASIVPETTLLLSFEDLYRLQAEGGFGQLFRNV